ncbi:hypothetical protein OKE68_04405 [Riemerella anatipestifer]|uniref:Uncharacterized protein n=1 Tax=Riemerella anatipestifer TaxID=34085 RepID=A0AAP3AKG5_RIEAN|nr:hypothetical protein [Riemerella anatipestifer]AZZ59804.1 hypothetical protein AWB57_09135 [Riemerella anatipestifer]MBT0573748.1 hypothetical protein [Riemerella anatipestifer]MCU7568015.1 hypothetical protein [Riemerella anatipestifer]MCW0490036.1 hypothetical protein [Riemerella anatipestifer]MCW0510691.1 hypothetical protein [Riemerella anatipestifer]
MATIKKLQTLFSKKGFNTDERHEVIYNFTNGRTQSSRELSTRELEDLCNALEGIKKSKTKLISTCLSILEAEGIHRPNEPILEFTEKGAKPNPFGHLNKWMLERSIYKKPLAFHSVSELEVLLRQLHKLAENNKKSAKKFGNKAYWNKADKLKNLN